MNRPLHDILHGHTPVPADWDTFVAWDPEHTLRRVAETIVETQTGTVWVSTVFLVYDHAFGEGPPVLFETMGFPQGGGSGELGQRRRSLTWEEAEAGHAEVVAAMEQDS